MLVAKGASSADLKGRLGGIWSAGKGPDTAKLDMFNAVMTGYQLSVIRKSQKSSNEAYHKERQPHGWHRHTGFGPKGTSRDYRLVLHL